MDSTRIAFHVSKIQAEPYNVALLERNITNMLRDLNVTASDATKLCLLGEILDTYGRSSLQEKRIIVNGAYTVLTYWPIYPRLIKICLVAADILSLLYAALVLCRRIRSRKYALKIFCRRLGLVAFMSKKIVGMSLALIMGFSGANVLFGSSLLKSDVRPATKTNLSEQTVADNMDTILLLQEDEWEKLSAQERLNVLQTVANIEQRYLGLPNELNVGVANLDADILGYYTDETHEIIVSADSLLYDSPWEVLDTICHEAYHSYQYRLVEALDGADENSKNLRIFRKAYTYADEFTSYKDGSTDFCGYYTQDCENDARDYAEDAVSDYYWRIMDHLEEGET